MNSKRKLENAMTILRQLQDRVKSSAFHRAMTSDGATVEARRFSNSLGDAHARIAEALAIECHADELEADCG